MSSKHGKLIPLLKSVMESVLQIHAHQLTYTSQHNAGKNDISLMLMRIENQFNPAFEAIFPNWPDVFIDGKKSTMLTKTFYNLPELTQIADLDLLILSIG